VKIRNKLLRSKNYSHHSYILFSYKDENVTWGVFKVGVTSR
jgi:hypothetical protein